MFQKTKTAVRTAFLVAILVAAVLGAVPLAVAQSAAPEGERVEQLERELAAIREELGKMRAEMQAKEAEGAEDESAGENAGDEGGDRFANIERKIDVLADEVERLKLGESLLTEVGESEYGLGRAASKVYQVEQGLSLGGYGEMLYSGYDSTRDDGAPADRDDQLDFLRAVLYVGYKFNDHWVFNSEIEIEHTSTDKEGSVSLEFAYFDYLWKPELNVRGGLLLVPVGFVNELHEPPLFLGARRPDVERNIIPTTWRENGVGIFGDVGGFSYRTYVLNGLEAADFSSSGIRGGRQKGSEALAEDFAWTGRLDYTGTPGLLAGVSAYIGNSGQNLRDANGSIDVQTTLFEGHLEWKYRGLEFRALGVRAELDDVSRLNQALGLTGSSSVGEELEGYYLQVGYDLLARRPGERAFMPYARWESFDTQSEVPVGFARNPARDIDILTLGFAYKPIDELIFKLDYQDFDNGAGTGIDQINVAFGYLF